MGFENPALANDLLLVCFLVMLVERKVIKTELVFCGFSMEEKIKSLNVDRK